jgi:hypothetical protein
VLIPEQALKRCNETRSSYSATRKLKDAFWCLQMAYDAGNQWGFITEQSGNATVQQLKGVFDTHSARRVRITINEIQHHTAKAASMTSPQQIKATVKGPCSSTDSYTRAAGKVLEALLQRIGALGHVRQANKDRIIVGSAGVRQTLRRVGSQKVGIQAQGRRKAAMLSQYEIDWAPVMPWEVIRSPGCKSTEMARDEDCIGHEKPRTLEWMTNHYGWAPETDTQLGQVIHFLDEIHRLENGPGAAPLLTEAREKAVIPCEYWLTDAAETARIYDETGLTVRWPWMFVGYLDPAKDNGAIQPVTTIGTNGLLKNPFCGPGMKFLHHHVATEAMWGTGMPWMLMQWQDFSNIGYTWLAESLQQSASKWLYEAGTLEVGKERKILNNDPWQPIPWKRQGQFSQPPAREAGAPVPQMARDIVSMAPEGMGRQTNIAGVQMGQGYKRDGSGKAYQALISEAETVPEDRVTGDEITLGELLRDTLIDTIRISTLEQISMLTGGRVSETYIKELKREDPRHRIAVCELHPTTMRPKTRQQTEERYSGLIERMILPQDTGVREAIRAGVTGLDTDRERAYQLQEAEIEFMRQGRPAEVLATDEHVWHIECLRAELNSPDRLDFDPQYVQMLQDHIMQHQQAQIDTAGMAVGQPEMPAEQPAMRGTPAAAGQQANGPAGPQLRIA